MKKILTVGVFDYFHYGHLKLFEQAKQVAINAYLIVAVQESEHIHKRKPDAKVFYSTNIRKELVGALKCVDEVVTYTDVELLVRQIDFDVLALGQDQNHSGFMNAIQWCEKNNKPVVWLHRTPDISSSDIKNKLQAQL